MSENQKELHRCSQLFERIKELEKEYIDFWIDICKIESPSRYKEGVDRVGQYIMEKAKARGWKIEINKQEVSGDCICITMNPDSKERPIAFSGHMDTVHPVGSFGPEVVRCEGDIIYGPGVEDCKGGIAAIFYAMAALQDCGFTKRPVMLLLQSDEEVGSGPSNGTTVQFMCEKAKNAIGFINCEGRSWGKATMIRKGISRYTFEVTGKAAHSAACFMGVNAVCEAAHKIIELEKLKNPDGLTCNCGIIQGGTVSNVVPEKCTFVADVRFSNRKEMEEADRIMQEVAETSFLEGTSCKVELSGRRCAMEEVQRNMDLLAKVNKINEEVGLPILAVEKSGGGSDAADVTTYGIPCIDSLGIVGGKIHSLNEFAYLSGLVEVAKSLAAIAYCIEE